MGSGVDVGGLVQILATVLPITTSWDVTPMVIPITIVPAESLANIDDNDTSESYHESVSETVSTNLLIF